MGLVSGVVSYLIRSTAVMIAMRRMMVSIAARPFVLLVGALPVTAHCISDCDMVRSPPIVWVPTDLADDCPLNVLENNTMSTYRRCKLQRRRCPDEREDPPEHNHYGGRRCRAGVRCVTVPCL